MEGREYSAAKRGGAFNGGYHIGVAGMQTFAAVCANVWNADKPDLGFSHFADAEFVRRRGTLIAAAQQGSPVRFFVKEVFA